MSYTLVEPCCGSAAFTLHLLGARRAVLSYQGSKWRFRHALQAYAHVLGFRGPPQRVVLTDPGPWGRALGVILDHPARKGLVEALRELAREDPFEVFQGLQGSVTPEESLMFAAEFLFLQRLSFSGKAVGTRNGRWASPGFNKTCAYGVAATSLFGEVRPMLPSLIRTLEAYEAELIEGVEVVVRHERAQVFNEDQERVLVYLDPPYAGSTSYPDGQMTRAEVVSLAEAWQTRGAAVMISEQHALDLPGWQRSRLYSGRGGTSPFHGKQEEWLTYFQAARP